MAESKRKDAKIACPKSHYPSPNDIAKDHTLSQQEKTGALNTWEQDARQLLTASDEGMAGGKEGRHQNDHYRLGEISRAKTKIQKET